MRTIGIGLVLLAIALPACSSDDDEAPAPTETGGVDGGQDATTGSGGVKTDASADASKDGAAGAAGGAAGAGGGSGGAAGAGGGSGGTAGSGGTEAGAGGSEAGTGGTDAAADAEADVGTDSAATDSGNDTGSTQDAGADTDAGLCTSIANTATTVPVTTVDASIPTGTGGAVVDGTYYLTAAERYSPTIMPQIDFRQTVKITGGNTLEATADDSDQPPFTKLVTFTTNGTSIVFTRVCSTEQGGAETQFTSYTADSTHVSLYSSTIGVVVTFTKQ